MILFLSFVAYMGKEKILFMEAHMISTIKYYANITHWFWFALLPMPSLRHYPKYFYFVPPPHHPYLTPYLIGYLWDISKQLLALSVYHLIYLSSIYIATYLSIYLSNIPIISPSLHLSFTYVSIYAAAASEMHFHAWTGHHEL